MNIISRSIINRLSGIPTFSPIATIESLLVFVQIFSCDSSVSSSDYVSGGRCLSLARWLVEVVESLLHISKTFGWPVSFQGREMLIEIILEFGLPIESIAYLFSVQFIL
jgi:hypothetical protein